ncbi:MAG: hypothetical protein ABUL58_03960, partial [Steroidobacter sp.]
VESSVVFAGLTLRACGMVSDEAVVLGTGAAGVRIFGTVSPPECDVRAGELARCCAEFEYCGVLPVSRGGTLPLDLESFISIQKISAAAQISLETVYKP